MRLPIFPTLVLSLLTLTALAGCSSSEEDDSESGAGAVTIGAAQRSKLALGAYVAANGALLSVSECEMLPGVKLGCLEADLSLSAGRAENTNVKAAVEVENVRGYVDVTVGGHESFTGTAGSYYGCVVSLVIDGDKVTATATATEHGGCPNLPTTTFQRLTSKALGGTYNCVEYVGGADWATVALTTSGTKAHIDVLPLAPRAGEKRSFDLTFRKDSTTLLYGGTVTAADLDEWSEELSFELADQFWWGDGLDRSICTRQ